MRRYTIGGRRTPEPPTSPPEPSHCSDTHALTEPSYEIDGPSVADAERVDGAFITVEERAFCKREGCDAEVHVRHVYSEHDVPTAYRSLLDEHEVWKAHTISDVSPSVDEDGNTFDSGEVLLAFPLNEEPYVGIGWEIEPRDSRVIAQTADGSCYGQPRRR